MRLVLVPEGEGPDWPVKQEWEEGYSTQEALLKLFEEVMFLQNRKAQFYSEAWRDQGWVGNVGRVLSKASRLRNMLWRDQPIDSSEESIVDTLQDLMMLAAFAIINYRDRNKWGR